MPEALTAKDWQRGSNPEEDAFDVDDDHRLPVLDPQVVQQGDGGSGKADNGLRTKSDLLARLHLRNEENTLEASSGWVERGRRPFS